MSSDRGAPLRGHRRPSFNRCLVCNQKVKHHSDGINVGEGLVHVKACARKYRKERRHVANGS